MLKPAWRRRRCRRRRQTQPHSWKEFETSEPPLNCTYRNNVNSSVERSMHLRVSSPAYICRQTLPRYCRCSDTTNQRSVSLRIRLKIATMLKMHSLLPYRHVTVTTIAAPVDEILRSYRAMKGEKARWLHRIGSRMAETKGSLHSSAILVLQGQCLM
jgi:hypothetical protein